MSTTQVPIGNYSPGTISGFRNVTANMPSVPQPPVSILGSFQLPNAQSNQASLGSNLRGISQARAADTAGFNESSQFIREGATAGIGAIGRGEQRGVDRIEQGLTQARSSLAGLIGTTEKALGRFSLLAGLAGDPSGTLEALQNDPSYQFRFNEGQRALQFGQAAGGIQGGRAAKELQAFGQGLASQEFESIQGRLLNLIGIGAPAIQQQAQYEQQAGSQIADIYGQGGAQRANILGQQGSSLASLRSQLAQNISTSFLAEGAARSQFELNRNPVLSIVTQQGNRIGTRALNLATSAKTKRF